MAVISEVHVPSSFWAYIVLALVLAFITIAISVQRKLPKPRPSKPVRFPEAPLPPEEKELPKPLPPGVTWPPARAAEAPGKPEVEIKITPPALPWVRRFKLYLRTLFPRPTRKKPVVRPAKEPMTVKFVSGHGFTRKLALHLAEIFKGYIPKAALYISPYKFAAEHVFWVVASLPAAAVAPVLALLVHPVFLLLLLLPPLAFLAPYLRLKSKIGDHKRAVDAELPFFTVHAAVSQSAGLNIYDSLCSTIGKGVFKEIEKAASAVKRNFKVLGMSTLDAVEKLGREHPHPGLRSLLLGYTSEFRSGGNIAQYLESRADEYLRHTRSRHEKYARDVGIIMELVLSAFLIVPAVLVAAMVLAPVQAMTLGTIFLAIGIPAVVAMCVAMVRATQPKDYTQYDTMPLPLLLLFVPILALVYRAFSLWTALGVMTGIVLFFLGLPVLFQKIEVSAHEKSLPQFLRDVTEYQKIGYPVTKAVATLCDQPAYTQSFRDLLRYVTLQLRLGKRLSEIKIPSRSWLTRLTFFHLGQVAESGGLSPRSTELLTEFITRAKETRDEARSTVSIHRIIAFCVPIVLAFIGAGMISALQAFSAIQVPAVPELPTTLFVQTAVPSVLYDIIYAVVLFSSVSVAFLTSYATDFTAKNTVWAAVGAFIAAVAISVIPAVVKWVLALVGFM